MGTQAARSASVRRARAAAAVIFVFAVVLEVKAEFLFVVAVIRSRGE